MLKGGETAVGEKGKNREPLGSSYKLPCHHVTFWLWHSVTNTDPFFHINACRHT